MYRLTALVVVLLGLSLLFGALAGHKKPVDRDKVVYHIDSGLRSRELDALRSLQNNIDAEGAANMDIKVMLYGDGLSLLLVPNLDLVPRGILLKPNGDAQMQARVDMLREEGVTFLVCGSCAHRRGIDPLTDLYQVSAKDVVKNGMTALARLEEEGYTYVKP